MPKKHPILDVRARILQLEKRRIALLGTADTADALAGMYRRFSAARATGSVPAKYRELAAKRLADAAIASAYARCLTAEIGALRAISGERLQGLANE